MLGKFLSKEKIFLFYLVAVSVVGMMIIYVATSSYGPGVSGDSVRFLSVAQNLLAGKGFFDYSLGPLLAWPPLYSIILALLGAVTGDVFVAGWVLNIFLFGFTIYLMGLVIANIVPDQLIYAYMGPLVVMVLPSLVRVYSIIAADPLFMFLSLVFFRQSVLYLQSGKITNLFLMCFLAILAGLVKYPGLVLSVTGSFLITTYYFRQQRRWTGLWSGGVFFLISILPLLGWVFFHNYLMYGSFFGDRGYAEPLGNLYIAVEKILYWFIPYNIIQRATPYGLILLILLTALIIVQPASWRRWFDRLLGNEILPMLLYAVLYGLALVFLVSYAEHKYFRVDRLHIALVFPLLVFLVSAVDTLLVRWDFLPRASFLPLVVAVVCFFAWLSYPAYNTYKYINRSLAMGETDNNLYNTKALRESDIVAYLENNPFSPDGILYSNHEGAAWFYTRHNVLGMPQGDRASEENQDIAKVLDDYREWPPEAGTIIWFDLDFKLHILPPDNLTPLAVITLVYHGNSGSVYQVALR